MFMSSSFSDSDPSAIDPRTEALVKAILSRHVPSIAQLVNTCPEQQRSQILTPALSQLAASDPASAQWFIRHLLAPEARQQLKAGIHAATVEYLQASGFVEGRDFAFADTEMWLSRAALPYSAPDDDPFGQLLVAEFCQLRE
jgi:hypothetical protein